MRQTSGAISEAFAALERVAGGATAATLETPTLDFKQENKSDGETIRDLLDAAVCFANSNGGVIVVGVADKAAGAAAFVGAKLSPELVRNRIFELSRPNLTVEVQVDKRFGRDVLLVLVPRSPAIHSDTQGRATRRVGTNCLPMTPDEQSRLRDERAGFDWTATPSDTKVSEASALALDVARRRLGTLTDIRREYRKQSDVDLLRTLRVVADSGRVLTRAGEILFREPAPDRPHVVYQYRTTPGGEPKVVERLAVPLIIAFERALELVQARLNMAPVTLPTGQQLQLEDFPELAVREALSNAVIHRDYHLSFATQVEHSPEVLSVTSPGPLVSGVTPANILTHPSKPRNPSLASAFRVLGLAEEVGRGVDRMYREMIRSGGRIPQIASNPDTVRVTLVGGAPNTQIARFVAQLPPDEREDTDTMLVLFRLCQSPLVSAVDLAPLLHRSEDEAEAILRRLASERVALIEPSRETARRAKPSYRLRAEVLKSLGRAVAYHRRSVDEIDRKVVAHVREYGTVTNKTVQNLLDVSLQRAKTILADLVQRDILIKVSPHERGPGVQYGPGTKFPARAQKRGR